jgi:hypothetical protein
VIIPLTSVLSSLACTTDADARKSSAVRLTTIVRRFIGISFIAVVEVQTKMSAANAWFLKQNLRSDAMSAQLGKSLKEPEEGPATKLPN